MTLRAAEKNLWKRYQKALKKRFKVLLTYTDDTDEAYAHYLASLPNKAVYLLSLTSANGGHAVLLYKENDQYYYYDPNEETISFMKPLESEADMVKALRRYAGPLEGMGDKVFLYADQLDISDVHYPKDRMSLDEAGVLDTPVAQGEIVDIVALYFNSVYKPEEPVKANGVCYGLSAILRELLVQTGSAKEAGGLFNQSMHRLGQKAKDLGIDSDEKAYLTEEQKEELGQEELILSMIPFFFAVQNLSVSEETQGFLQDSRYQRLGIAHLEQRKPNETTRRVAMPLSIPMETLNKPGKEYISNPMSIYDLLKSVEAKDVEHILESLEVDNFEGVDQDELVNTTKRANSSLVLKSLPHRLKCDVRFMEKFLEGRQLTGLAFLSDEEFENFARQVGQEAWIEPMRQTIWYIFGNPTESHRERIALIQKFLSYQYEKDQSAFIQFVTKYLTFHANNDVAYIKAMLPDKALKDPKVLQAMIDKGRFYTILLPEKALEEALKTMSDKDFDFLCASAEDSMLLKKALTLKAKIDRDFVENFILGKNRRLDFMVMKPSGHHGEGEEILLKGLPDTFQKDPDFMNRFLEKYPEAQNILDENELNPSIRKAEASEVERAVSGRKPLPMPQDINDYLDLWKFNRHRFEEGLEIRLSDDDLCELFKEEPVLYAYLPEVKKKDPRLAWKVLKAASPDIVGYVSDDLKESAWFMFFATLINPDARYYARSLKSYIAVNIAYVIRRLISPWMVSEVSTFSRSRSKASDFDVNRAQSQPLNRMKSDHQSNPRHKPN